MMGARIGTAVLMSGGVDSSIVYAKVRGENPDAEGVWYDFGQAAAQRERAALPNSVWCRELPWQGARITRHGAGTDAFYLPGRNALLMMAMVCHHEPREALFGGLVNECRESDVDKNDTFRALLSSLASYVMGTTVSIRAPLAELGLDKARAIQWARTERLLTDGELRNTYSCYEHTPLPFVGCGSCRQCLRRYLVFNSLGIKDPPSDYMIDPLRGAGADLLALLIESDREELWGLMPRSTLGWAHWGLRAGASGALRVAMERLLEERK
jgi:7-cyano-7-deazaguanine synthase in queuosine biosynthesis